MSLTLYDLTAEYMARPLGLDCKTPRFAWKLKSGERDVLQMSYHIIVGTERGACDAWDSGVVYSDESNGVIYDGNELKPVTGYYWSVVVTDNRGNSVRSKEQYFETGFLDPSLKPWDGAKWIGPERETLSSDTRGVFGISCKFRIEEGSTTAGLVVGAFDKRIPDRDNYFRFDVDVSGIPAKLKIYRVGIAKDDREDVPFAEVPVVDFDDPDKKPVITEENRYETHEIDVEITGDCEYTSIDGKRVDVIMKPTFWGTMEEAPRQLNPMGSNDVNTYPRMNEIGYFVYEDQKVTFSELKVRNLRKPYAVIFEDKEEFTPDSQGSDCMVTMDPSHTSIPMLRRFFSTRDENIRSARLYATARGIYEVRVNGEPVTDDWFNPGCTQYDRHIMYQTYDITDLLGDGENAVGVILAPGWWSDGQTFSQANFNYFGDRPSFLAKLVVTYESGEQDLIVTDTENWKYSGEGPWKYASFFHGEHYDATREEAFAGFSEPDYDDSEWTSPVVITPVPIGEGEVASHGPVSWPYVNQQEPEIIGQVGSGVKAVYEITAQSVKEVEPGSFIFDMGVNVAGVPKVRLKGEAGSSAMLRFAEILCPDFPEFEGRVGTLMVENLRDADCTDIYTFKGNPEGEEYMPRFTFRGYRYIEISGVTERPALEDVKLVVLSSVTELTGDVRVSNPMVNFFLDNVRRSMRSNFISIPTDCPQRNERMGWDGDTSIFARTATFNADTRLFYSRWLMTMRDLQEPDGKYADIAPIGGGFGGFTYESSAIHTAWELYQQYGDIEVIKENYEAMKKFMDYSAKNLAAGSLAVGFTLGDWLAPEETNLELICHAFYGYDARLMARMAKAIDKDEDAKTYEALYQDLKASFNRKWFDPGTGKTADDTQCSYALPLSYRMVSDDLIQKVGDRLDETTRRLGCKVNTGFFGTSPLNPMLTEAGHADTAFATMEQTECPSWLYPVTQGATSIWERWDSYTVENGFGGHNSMNSFDHYSLGSVYEWFYMYVLGIMRDEVHPGYKHFQARPAFGCWDYAKGGFETPYGRIDASWEKTESGYLYKLTVPANTTAEVKLPGRAAVEVGSGSYEFMCVPE